MDNSVLDALKEKRDGYQLQIDRIEKEIQQSETQIQEAKRLLLRVKKLKADFVSAIKTLEPQT